MTIKLSTHRVIDGKVVTIHSAQDFSTPSYTQVSANSLDSSAKKKDDGRGM